jgi:hypothetical protein
MPVQRFRTFDEAARALWMDRDDPQLPNRIRIVWSRARRLAPGDGRRGLRRYRSVLDDAAQRER